MKRSKLREQPTADSPAPPRKRPKPSQNYRLRLYVTGATPRSLRAINSIKRICEEHLHGHYELEVVDVYQQPARAKADQLVAAPTLIKVLPFPLRRLIGDMANSQRVLVGLDIEPATAEA